MAMRPPRRGRVLQPRPSLRPTYENIRPRSEWKHEDDATILLLYLSGFLKEQIRIEVVESSGLIKIQGQRPLGGGRWGIFNQSFNIPSACDSTKLNTQFELGVLTIVMPNKSTLSANQNQNDPKIVDEPKTTQQQQLLPTGSTTPQHDQTSTTEKVALQDEDKLPTKLEKADDKKEHREAIPEDKLPTKLEKAEGKKEHREVIPEDKLSTKLEYRESSPEEKQPKAENHSLQKNGDGEEKVHIGGQSKIEKHDQSGVVVEKETVKSSEGQVLLNVLIAVLVLMGLGAHISYTIGFGSSKTA